MASFIYNLSTGSPQTVSGQDLTGTSYSSPDPNRICDANSGPGIHTRLQWFNTGCFVNPPFGTWGNATIGDVTEPAINNWDIALAKTFALPFIGESHRVEFRSDPFNAFNHTQ